MAHAVLGFMSSLLVLLILCCGTGARAGPPPNAEKTYHCIHDELIKTMPLDNKRLQPQKYLGGLRKRDSDQYQPIRLDINTAYLSTSPALDTGFTCYAAQQVVGTMANTTYVCQEQDVLTPAKSDFIITKLLSYAKAKLEEALSVIPVQVISPFVSSSTSREILFFPKTRQAVIPVVILPSSSLLSTRILERPMQIWSSSSVLVPYRQAECLPLQDSAFPISEQDHCVN